MITRELAAYAATASFADLPVAVQTEIPRAFLNWMGCVLGGCREHPVELAAASLARAPGPASVIGRRERTDVATAALLNSFSSSVLSYDDTHLATVTHPTGPVAAAIFALSETRSVSGQDFAIALAIGIEIECRLSNALLLPPARANVGLYVTGLTGPIGAAAALGRLLALDERRMTAAIGLAAAQAAGFRATHGAMSGLIVPAFGARNAVEAALLAASGFTATETMLEAPNGFLDTFSPSADATCATVGLGTDFEVLANAYKPYPSGIVIHAAIDACLEVAVALPPNTDFASVQVTVHPLALTLTDRRNPVDPLEAQISLYHWVAATLLHRVAGAAELQQACIDDPAIVSLRTRVTATTDDSLRRNEAIVAVALVDGTTRRAHVLSARGSADRPMTDANLDAKFRTQAASVVGLDSTETLLRLCRDLPDLRDVGQQIAAVWSSNR